MKPTVAIIGRPNVGKSSFFNKAAGARVAIVDDTPGVTRDRLYADAEWNGKTFVLTDTGGLEPQAKTELLRQMRAQAELAVAVADVIVFMTDLRAGVTADDRDIASRLLKSRKPVVLAVNKVDAVGTLPPEFYEFYELGLGDPIALSSLHGTGTGDVLDRIAALLPDTEPDDAEDDAIRVAVIGKPNVGKSSLVNRFAGETRSIVSEVPGTTRDALDTRVENEHGRYVFVDTAGIRRGAKITDEIEKYSVLRARRAAESADVCLVMCDASTGITAQDERIAGISHNAGKAAVIVLNKWDAIEKDNSTANAFRKKVYDALSYMTYAPLAYISAKTGQRADRLFGMINEVHENACRRISTGVLNEVLNDAMDRVQPPTDKGKRLKIYYITQTGVKPPTFVVFCNSAKLFHFSYRRYLENRLREVFGFSGTPLRLIVKQKDEG